MKHVLRSLFLALPVYTTFAIIFWTAAVTPYTRAGEDWGTLPVAWGAPIVLFAHTAIVLIGPRLSVTRASGAIYAFVHLSFFTLIWFICLMTVDKNSL